MKPGKTLYIVDRREPVLLSWLRDGFSFGALMLTAWFTNTQMPPSGWINFALAASWFLWVAGKAEILRQAMDAGEARIWLNANYPDAGDARP